MVNKILTSPLPAFLILVCVLAGSVCAQTTVMRFDHINSEQGLSHNTVSAILQDSSGYMWFGTVDGLNRFDGYQCQVFKHNSQDPQSLPGNFIHSLLEDRQGNLWIGTRGAGLAVLTPEGRKTNHFQSFQPEPDNPNSISNLTVQTVYQDGAGRLWVGTRSGLDLLDWENGRFIHYGFFENVGPEFTVTSLVEDSHGILWAATFEGLFALDLADFETLDPNHCSHRARVWRHDVANPNSLGSNSLNNVFVDRQERLWVTSRGHGLSLFKDGAFQHYLHDPENPQSLSGNNASVHFQDEQGRLWIGADGRGLNIFNPETGIFERHRHLPSRTDSLSNDNITQAYQSQDGEDGVVWVITWGGGVNKRIVEDKPFALIQHEPDNPNSLSSNFVFSIHEDRFGDLWIGTIGSGLNRWRRDTGSWDRYIHDPNNPNSISDNHIWSISQDSADHLWFTTEFGGLNQLIRQKRDDPVVFIHHRRNRNGGNGLADNNIKAFLEDARGNFWVGYESAGLGRQTPQQRETGNWTHITHNPQNPNSLSNNAIQCLYQDSAGFLWIGTFSGGLNKWQPKSPDHSGFVVSYQNKAENSSSLGSNDIRAILETSDGRLMVGTFEGGLNVLMGDGKGFQQFTTEDGLANNTVYGLEEDERGDLWISTNRGLSKCNLEDMSFTNFGVSHGLQSDEFNTGAHGMGNRGELFFGGVNGFNLFSPKVLWEQWNRTRVWLPPVVLTGFARMGQPEDLNLALAYNGSLNLEHSDKFFSFEMAVLDYHNPAKNRFAYQLAGFDTEWIDNGSRNFVNYTNLDPGHYVFRYKGADNAGVWNEGQPLAIVISPPFWQTWWFRGLLVLLTVAAVAAGFQVKKFYHAWRGTRFVGHFKILSPLGSGGSGTVYLARNKVSKQVVALKVLNSAMEDTKDGIRRFLQEAEIGQRLSHPNIVEIFEAGNHEKTRFISMEYLKGQTLKDYLGERGRQTESEIFPLAVQIMAGLEAIHAQNIVHRDLKSGNVMVLENGQVKIMDFGLARISALTTVENRDSLMGTLAYMSPEQTIGKAVDHRSDLYALGVILYEMWFGELPFSAQNEMEMIYAIHNEPPSGLGSGDLEHAFITSFISTCLEKNPQDRFPSVQALKTAFITGISASRADDETPNLEQSSPS